jgi:2-polyprenyl-3-methyl-5-hydroxy-6-metoxy-1,4-benzoquinol methylase
MSSVAEHYDRVLSDVYAWMLGGFDTALARNRELFERLGVAPGGSRLAVDLGAGCGFQSIPLADRGFAVTAIDIDRKLLEVLTRHAGTRPITVVRDDLLRFAEHLEGAPELIVCMTDTLLHLESREDVAGLFGTMARELEPGGRVVLTYRDLSRELEELDRFMPVRSDADTIFTCYLEYEPETVKVHDLVHRRTDDGWRLHKSFYRKLRLPQGWVDAELARAGLRVASSTVERGLVTTIAAR